MKGLSLFFSLCLVLLGPVGSGEALAASPTSLVGITLGSNVDNIQDKVDMSTALPIWHQDYLTMVALKPLKGYRSGYIVYGNCKVPGRIVRVKLNYADDGVAFYNDVLNALTKSYGKPMEWHGNPFGTLRIWKWYMKDAQNNSISLTLQRYEGDDDSFSRGNSIKFGMSNLMDEEKECYEARDRGKQIPQAPAGPEGGVDLDWFLPK